MAAPVASNIPVNTPTFLNVKPSSALLSRCKEPAQGTNAKPINANEAAPFANKGRLAPMYIKPAPRALKKPAIPAPTPPNFAPIATAPPPNAFLKNSIRLNPLSFIPPLRPLKLNNPIALDNPPNKPSNRFV